MHFLINNIFDCYEITLKPYTAIAHIMFVTSRSELCLVDERKIAGNTASIGNNEA